MATAAAEVRTVRKTKPKAKGVTKRDEKRYYEEADGWEFEMYRSARGRARIWAVIAGISVILSCLSVLTLMLVVPLKETIPYVIEVDRASGIVEVKRPLIEGGISESEALTKYFIVDYLNAREAYLYDRAQVDYTKVQKMSSQDIAAAHYTWFNPGNEKSPLNVFGKSGTVEIEIRYINFIDEDTATIPVVKTEKIKGQIRTKYEVITMSFQFLNDPATEEDRLINPLGFQVTAYRNDPQLIEED